MLHIGQGATVGGVTLFPVWADRTSTGPRRYDLGTANLDVAETDDADGGPSVPHLVATNLGARPVLVLDGQLFEGGWQHRMATRSTLVPAAAQTLVEVACVEQRRWGGGTAQTTRGRRAPAYVRAGAEEAGGQSEVWSRVSRYAGGAATDSLLDRYAPEAGHRHDGTGSRGDVADRILQRVRPLPGQTGVLVGLGGQPLALEVFDHPDTLREQLEAIVRAAGLDAELAGLPAQPTPGRRARRMVARLERTRLTLEPDVGQTARLGRARTTHLDVMSLRAWHRQVHLRVTHRHHPLMTGAPR